MAVPTITGVSPTVMFTGGQMLTIMGTNFRTAYPVDLNTTAPIPKPPPTMSVLIGTRAAKNVVVSSATQLTCIAPPTEPGDVTVTVQNLDAAGVAIAGETASSTTLLDAARADLTVEADLTRLERVLMRELKRQVIENVLKTAAVDYDGTPGAIFEAVDMAKLPALAIQGPQLVVDRFYDMDVGLVRSDGGTGFIRHRPYKTVNLTYRFVAMDDKQVRNMNLMALMLQFLQNNPYLEMLRVHNDSTRGYVKYEMEQVGEFTTFTGSSTSNIRGFSGSLVIRGFQLEDVAGFVDQTVAERGQTVDNEVSVDTQDNLPT